VELPRYVVPKKLTNGRTAFYFRVHKKYLDLGCPVTSEPLGTDYAAMCKRAEVLNGLFDEWDDQRKGLPISGPAAPRYGTIDWLFREYKQSKAYLEKVAPRSRGNYEWNMRAICNMETTKGARVGTLPVRSISPRAADKLYDRFTNGPKGERLRTAEKLTVLCRKAWRVVHRLFPAEFDRAVPNPWSGVTMRTRVKLVKGAVGREEVYTFAHGCVERGQPEAAAVAVICFEWLQRPENVIAGHIRWSDYRAPNAPNTIRILRPKWSGKPQRKTRSRPSSPKSPRSGMRRNAPTFPTTR
jgi:hypothetical protein